MIVSIRSLKFTMLAAIAIILVVLPFSINLCISISQEYTFYQNAEKVYGVVDKIERYTSKGYRKKYSFYVSYTTLDGEKYNNIKAEYVHIYGRNCKSGDSIIVFYDKNTPTKTGVGTYSLNGKFLWIIGFLGLIIWMAVILLKSYKEFKMSNFLINNGLKGFAEITKIIPKGVGKYRRYIVYYVVTHPIYQTRSHHIQELDQVSARHLFIGQSFTAYFDQINPVIYRINL